MGTTLHVAEWWSALGTAATARLPWPTARCACFAGTAMLSFRMVAGQWLELRASSSLR